jgi:chorismate-pyruvate lyase
MLERYYAKTKHAAIDTPFRCEGYVPGGTIRGVGEADVLLERLPPFLRALLVTDGTVTKILEAYFWEPVEVDTLRQELSVAEAEVAWINVPEKEQVLVRQARLRGAESGNVYAMAFSVIRPALIPAPFRQRLINQEIGIGVLIRDSGLESYREVIDAGVERGDAYEHMRDATRPRPMDLVYRTYRIIIDGKPVILITESFPWELYR